MGQREKGLFLTLLSRSSNMKSLYRKNIALTNKSAIGFSSIHSFCYMTILFDGCSSFGHFARNLQKTTTVTPSSYCNFSIYYTWLSIGPSLKKIWIVHPFEVNYLQLLQVKLWVVKQLTKNSLNNISFNGRPKKFKVLGNRLILGEDVI